MRTPNRSKGRRGDDRLSRWRFAGGYDTGQVDANRHDPGPQAALAMLGGGAADLGERPGHGALQCRQHTPHRHRFRGTVLRGAPERVRSGLSSPTDLVHCLVPVASPTSRVPRAVRTFLRLQGRPASRAAARNRSARRGGARQPEPREGDEDHQDDARRNSPAGQTSCRTASGRRARCALPSGWLALELCELLQPLRGRIDPEAEGLPECGSYRRMPGLRREEIAQLAAVSTDYYTSLEQGRNISPSDNMLQASPTRCSSGRPNEPTCSTW